REGAEYWNRAFAEECGILNAIEIRQQDKSSGSHMDKDPEDVRYNFIRWIVSGRSFAMGPSRVDPRTGQILDADIIFDDSMLRSYQTEIDLLGPKALAREVGPEKREFWMNNPAFLPMGVTLDDVRDVQREHETAHNIATSHGSNFGTEHNPNMSAEAKQRIADLMGEDVIVTPRASRVTHDHGQCEHAVGMRRQLAMTQLLFNTGFMRPGETTPTTKPGKAGGSDNEGHDDAKAKGGDEEKKTYKNQKLPEKYVGRILKEIVAHEVGHTLGLRHNFKASSWLSLDEIKERRADPTVPSVSSVMDYNATLLFAGDNPEDIETFITPVIGPYDYWAIEYGYKTIRGPEAKELEKIAGRAGEKALAYATDGEVRGLGSPDPSSNRFDMGDDPLEWAKSRIEFSDELMKNIEQWAIEDGLPNEQLRTAFLNVFFERIGAMTFVARNVGGQYFSVARFDDKIDGGDKPGLTPVPAETQRETLEFLAATLFNDDFFDVDPELLNKIVASRYTGGTRIDFPIHATILNAQNRALSALTSPTVLQRIYDAEVKIVGDDKFTAAELIEGVSEAVWTEPEGGELISIRRNLQMQHVDYLVAMVDSEPGRLMSADLQNMVRFQMRQVAEKIDGMLEGDLEMATAAHLTEAKSRIEKVLDAPYVNMPAGGGQTIIMMGQTARDVAN
ncbi:MAG: zinc-dependent metalloprotease, partial [Planctomycetota bacterium]